MQSNHKSRTKRADSKIEKAKIRDRIFVSMAGFLPRYLVEQNITEAKKTAKFDIREVVLLQADISGFTAMSEKLAALGKQGSEEVNRIINNFFGPLIDLIH